MIGSPILHRTTCANSIAWAKKIAAQVQHGTLLIATNLKAARGRQGRTWEILPGQLLLTYVLKPCSFSLTAPTIHRSTPLTYLFMALSNGLCRAIQTHAHSSRLKWPNDIVIEHKKCAGLIIEIVWKERNVQALILGIGINANTTFPNNHPLASIATSIASQKKSNLKPNEVLNTINFTLEKYYQAWQRKEYDTLFHEWRSLQTYKETLITVHRYDGTTLTGIAEEYFANGGLLLIEQHNGATHYLSFSEVAALSPFPAPL